MIAEERMRVFLNSLDSGDPDWLEDLRLYSEAENGKPA